MTMKGRPTLKTMTTTALPMVRQGLDYQKIQHVILNDWDGLTNSDVDDDFIMDAIHAAEKIHEDED